MRAFAVKLGLLALMLSAVSFMPSVASAQVRVGVAITIAPPILPVYEQPICPGDGYMWTPGYWAWGDDGYFWVPGTWVLAPEPGFLWTPGYWGWGDGSYVWYDGFWGPTVGFYGGISYGFGYFGVGFVGGRWDHGHFFYNSAVWHVNETVIHNVYNERVTNVTVNRVSFNGPGGIDRRPNAAEEAAAHERHLPPSHEQVDHVAQARSNPALRASENHGRPSIAATPRAGDFKGNGVEAAREEGAEANRAEANRAERPATSNAVHVKDLPPIERPAAPNTGDAKLDKKYQQQQNKLIAQQEKDRQKLEKQQEKEDARLSKQHADQARTQAQEQRHQQQTQSMVQRHTEQRQSMMSRQSAPAPSRR
jgi:WXXGXW repeat (2 copies)